MRKKINRRQFLFTGLAGVTALGAGFTGFGEKAAGAAVVDKVRLGSTGLVVPRIAFGTGTRGGRRESNQTRLGTGEFIKLARHAYDRGIRFFDMADFYGSHTYVREVLKEIPRSETILLTKVWAYDSTQPDFEPPDKLLDRFRMETGADYFDIFLLHCMMNGNWKEEKKIYIDYISRAKQDGIIRTAGVSCHHIDALRVAAEDPWVDVIMARINPFGTLMDGEPDDVMALLETARKNGKGIIGMKIFGEGRNVTDDERERSISYAVNSPNVHCMTLGMESAGQVDDAVDRVMRNCTVTAV